MNAHSAWIEKDLRQRFPQLAEKATEVYEVYDRAVASGELRASDLLRLELYSNERSSMLRDCAASIVGALSDTFPQAGELLLKLVQDGRTDVGLSAVAALHAMQSTTLKESVVRIGLKHKSKSVRELAADNALRFRLHNVLGEIEGAAANERDLKCRESLRFSFALLKNGYLVERAESDAVSITVTGPRSVVTQIFSKEIVEKEGVRKLIDQLKSSAKF